MIAVVQDRNRQYRVAPGDRVLIDHNGALAVGDSVTFDQVQVVAGDTSSTSAPRVGTPFVKGVTVAAVVVRQDVKGPKLVIQKYKRRKNERRRTGFRARYTEVRIDSIEG
jgi:large subunit ribosomal protein L21